MSLQKEADYSHEHSVIMDNNYSKIERLAVLKSFTDRLKLTLDDISNSMNREKLNLLSIIPPDLLPFDVNLVDGNKVTIFETDPVVTFYDGELKNLQGDILHIYLKNEGEDLDEDLVPPKRVCTVTAETLDKVLPSIISDLFIPGANGSQVSIKPGTSKKPSMPCNAHSEGELLKKNSSQKIHEDCRVKLDFSSPLEVTNYPKQKTEDNKYKNIVVFKPESPCPEVGNIASEKSIETLLKENTSGEETMNQIDNGQRSDDETSPFQVIGLLDMGSARDSGSEEGLHNTVEDFDNNEWITRKETATIIVDKILGNQSEFKSDSLRIPPTEKKKIINVRKSARAHKPKIRSHFKSWDDIKIRLPGHRRRRTSKGTQVANQNVTSKKKERKKKALGLKT